jgi:hypothetical protein
MLNHSCFNWKNIYNSTHSLSDRQFDQDFGEKQENWISMFPENFSADKPSLNLKVMHFDGEHCIKIFITIGSYYTRALDITSSSKLRISADNLVIRIAQSHQFQHGICLAISFDDSNSGKGFYKILKNMVDFNNNSEIVDLVRVSEKLSTLRTKEEKNLKNELYKESIILYYKPKKSMEDINKILDKHSKNFILLMNNIWHKYNALSLSHDTDTGASKTINTGHPLITYGAEERIDETISKITRKLKEDEEERKLLEKRQVAEKRRKDEESRVWKNSKKKT